MPHGNRPVETITPLSAVLQLPYDDTYADTDSAHEADCIRKQEKYFDKTVLICWHHGNIPCLAYKLGVSKPPSWKGHVFDRVWRITYPGGKAKLKEFHQELLFGDRTPS